MPDCGAHIAEFVYTAFVTDAYSRRIVGWATHSTMTTEALSLEALEHALATAKHQDDAQLVHHSGRGSQYAAIAYTDKLADHGIAPSVGTVEASYDCQSVSTGFRKNRVVPTGVL